MQLLYLSVWFLAASVGSRASVQLNRTLLDCMREVESSGDICAIGDGGMSLGPYQIQQDYYTDATDPTLGDPTLTTGGRSINNVWGIDSISYSEEVIMAYMCQYATEQRLGRPPTDEDIARIHNGGPNGFMNSSTDVYWNAVSACIQRIQAGGSVVPTSGSPDFCEPLCEAGQCCQLDDNNNYACVCIADAGGAVFERVPCEECSAAGVDLMFVLDASGSVGSFNFNDRILPFVVDVVNELDIGANQSQVGVIRFASSPSILFNLNTHNNKTDLINAINGILYTGGGTDTAAALDLLRISGFAGARPVSQGIPRYAVVVTDGLSNSPPATIIAAMALHNVTPSITVYAAGISGANINELNEIASEPQFNTTFVIFISSFSDIESLTNMIITEACTAATTLDVAQEVERDIAVGVNVFLIFIVPAEGFTIRITVTVGLIRICGSRTVQRPDCRFSSTYDWIRVVTVTVDVFITPDGLDADSQSTVGRRRRQADADVPMFVTVEGVEQSNSFALNTTTGDDRSALPCTFTSISGDSATVECDPGTMCCTGENKDGGAEVRCCPGTTFCGPYHWGSRQLLCLNTPVTCPAP